MKGFVQKTLLRKMCMPSSLPKRGRVFLSTQRTLCINERTIGEASKWMICWQRSLPIAQYVYQLRLFSSDRVLDDNQDLCDEEEDLNDDIVLDDGEYTRLVQDAFGIPHRGHKVFIVQPVDRTRKDLPTTGVLQLEESIALVKSIPQWSVVGNQICGIRGQHKKLLLGKNQIKTLQENLQSVPGVTAVFLSVDILNKQQVKGLQKQLGLPVWDRYSLVIQIFKEHAKTQEAKLQVSVAEVFFLRKRLDEVHEGRDMINAPLVGGSGRTYIQARRILLKRRERKLRNEIELLKQQRDKLRENRMKRKIPTVAVIGYTNCGKTTLIKSLTGDSRMVPQDQLFATLDVTVHAGNLPNTMRALFVDTVGFISNIPSALMDAFSATLEDAILADLVIHVEDTSNPDCDLQRYDVMRTVKSMLTQQQMKTMLHVGNKIDKINISDLQRDESTMYVSAETGIGLDALREEIQIRLLQNTGFLQKKIRIPLNSDHLDYLYKEATVVSTENDSDQETLIVNIIISADSYEKFKNIYGKKSKKIKPMYRTEDRAS